MNQLKLTHKIQSLKEIIKDLDKLKSAESETISQLLKIITDLFQEVNQRLTKLENQLSQ